MSLFASGVASIIQIKAWGPVGSGLLSIQGTSFNFVAPLIMGGTALKTGGADVPTMMAALFGTLMLASCTEMVSPASCTWRAASLPRWSPAWW
jgi:xanthine permease XanP